MASPPGLRSRLSERQASQHVGRGDETAAPIFTGVISVPSERAEATSEPE
jgi:hypothetical protein